jgi:hypothetical protein
MNTFMTNPQARQIDANRVNGFARAMNPAFDAKHPSHIALTKEIVRV